MQLKFMLTIEAWDSNWFDYGTDQEIDVTVKSIRFEETNNKVNVVENGTNGIGQFNYSYRIQHFDSKNYSYECSINSVATTVTNPLPTSCTCNASVPNNDRTDQPLDGSSVTTSVTNPLHTSSTRITSVVDENSTDQPLAVSPSSLWTVIAVAIMLFLTLLVTIVIAICIVKNMSTKLNETKERNTCDSDGEHTCPVLVYVFLYLELIQVYIL